MYDIYLVSSGFQCAGGNDTTLHPDTTNCYYLTSVLDSMLIACRVQLDFNSTLQMVPVITQQMPNVSMVAVLQH